MSLIEEAILTAFGDHDDMSIIEFVEGDCDYNLYPRQRVLLKLIWLEEMEGWEEDILTEWTQGKNGVLISPMIRERRDYLRELGYPHFSETILVGGRRSSKSFMAGLSAAKKVSSVQRLGDPGVYFGIAPQKEIYFSCVAASLKQSKELQFADFVNATTASKSLRNTIFAVNEEGFRISSPGDAEVVRSLEADGVSVGRDFSRLRAQPIAANAATIRGTTSILQIYDEMAHMMEGTEGNQTATKCYEAGEPALQQFGKHAMTFLNSSPAAKIGKFHERFLAAMEVEDGQAAHPDTFAFQFPSWELYRGYEKDPKKRFKHALMVDPDTPDSEILCADDKVRRDKARLREKANPEEFSVEYRGEWADVIDSYFNPIAVEQMYRGHFEYPGEKDDEMVIAEVPLSNGGTYQHTYVAHIDPSSTTAGYGFALGHMEMYPDINFPGRMVPHVVYDVVHRWNPDDYPGGTIDQFKVVEEIIQWCRLFRPAHLTHDQFNAATINQMLRQGLQTEGLNDTRVYEDTGTNKKNWNKWEVMKTAANLGLLHVSPKLPSADWSMQELKFLQKKETGSTRRVVKQTTGPVQTKDVADAMRDVAYMLIGAQLANLLDLDFQAQEIVGGSPGGYSLGQQASDLGGLNDISQFYGGKGLPASHRGINPNRKRY